MWRRRVTEFEVGYNAYAHNLDFCIYSLEYATVLLFTVSVQFRHDEPRSPPSSRADLYHSSRDECLHSFDMGFNGEETKGEAFQGGKVN